MSSALWSLCVPHSVCLHVTGACVPCRSFWDEAACSKSDTAGSGQGGSVPRARLR